MITNSARDRPRGECDLPQKHSRGNRKAWQVACEESSHSFYCTPSVRFLCRSGDVAQEQRELRTITARSSELNNGEAVLAARGGKNSFELHCNKDVTAARFWGLKLLDGSASQEP